MPYIAQNMRPAFRELAPKVMAALARSGFEARLASFLGLVLDRVYGDAGKTRYYLQNEAIGVLTCMAMEWAARGGSDDAPAPEFDVEELNAQLSDELHAFAEALYELVPKSDITLRAGCLNYFITILMIAAVEQGTIRKSSVPGLILAIAYLHYARTTRPYEDSAIAKNGEVFPDGFFPS